MNCDDMNKVMDHHQAEDKPMAAEMRSIYEGPYRPLNERVAMANEVAAKEERGCYIWL